MSQTATETRHSVSPHHSDDGIELGTLHGGKGGKSDGPLEHDVGLSERIRKTESLGRPDDVPPPHAQGEVERWNYPRGNIGRLAFAFLSFIIAGMNDAAIGVCVSSSLLRNFIIGLLTLGRL